MGAKGGGGDCCCGPCDERGRAAVVHCPDCCTCVPKRICVSLAAIDARGNPDLDCECGHYGITPEDQQLQWDCDFEQYAGALLCAGQSIGVIITFERLMPDGSTPQTTLEGDCYIVLESGVLGYTGLDRLKLPLGGEYLDSKLVGTNCLALGYDFEVDLYPLGLKCDRGIISVRLDEMVQRVRIPPCDDLPYSCVYPVACITVDDEFKRVCRDDYTDCWEIELESGHAVTVCLEEFDPTTLRLVTSLGDVIGDDTVVAQCQYPQKLVDYRPDMLAEWEVQGYDRVHKVSIRADTRADCYDCGCWCRCLCVTYAKDEVIQKPRFGFACWEQYIDDCPRGASHDPGGWSVTLPDPLGEDPDVTISLSLVCDPCTGVTKLRLDDEPLVDDVAVICPDIEADWFVPSTQTTAAYHVTVRCAQCTDCQPPLLVACCDGAAIPVTLTAEIVNTTSGCYCAEGQTVSLRFNHNDNDPAWEGEIDICGQLVVMKLVCAWKLTLECGPCADAPGFDGCPAEEGFTCDPVEVVFRSAGAGCFACDDPATADFDVRITE